MQYSKEFLKTHQILPRISFKDRQPHTVKLVKDKLETVNSDKGPKDGVRYLVEENGEPKSFLTCSPNLISTLSSFEPGDIVTIQLQSKKSNGTLISVFKVEKEGIGSVDDQDEEPPMPDLG